MGTGVLDVLYTLELLHRRWPVRVEPQQLREAEHGVERRAQLMAHARQKLGLRLTGCLQRFASLSFCMHGSRLRDIPEHHRHQGATRGVNLRERSLHRKLLAIGAPAYEVVQRARIADGLLPCPSGGFQAMRDEAIN